MTKLYPCHLLAIFLLHLCISSEADQNFSSFRPRWTFYSGNTTNALTPNYNNVSGSPGHRWLSATWMDTSAQQLWLFAGSNLYSYINDVWMFDIRQEKWTWMAGTNITEHRGVYPSSPGQKNSTTVPSSRHGSAWWFDEPNRALYLFGGTRDGLADYNDLWLFNMTDLTWMLLNGQYDSDPAGNFGTKYLSVPANRPPPRRGGVMWSPYPNQLWLFAGVNSIGHLSDVWRFDLTDLRWTWMAGSQNFNEFGQRGPLNQTGPDYFPAARKYPSFWTNPGDRHLWTFGGLGCVRSPCLNVSHDENWADIWKFDPETSWWTWVAGPPTSNFTGIWNPSGPVESNWAGARHASSFWFDSTSNILWVLSGVCSQTESECFQELWGLNTSSLTWIAYKKNSLDYGTQKMASSTNFPSRRTGGLTWFDSLRKHAWLYAGERSADLSPSDLWLFGLYPDCNGLTTSVENGTCRAILDSADQSIPLPAPFDVPLWNQSSCLQLAYPTAALSSCVSSQCVRPNVCRPLQPSSLYSSTSSLCFVDEERSNCESGFGCSASGQCLRTIGTSCSTNGTCLSRFCSPAGVCGLSCPNPPPTSFFRCDAASGNWVASELILNNTNPTSPIPIIGRAVVTGNATLTGAVILFTSTASLRVEGCANIDQLSIQLLVSPSQVRQNAQFELVVSDANCLNATVKQITVENSDPASKNCATFTTAPQINTRTLTVLVQVNDDRCNSVTAPLPAGVVWWHILVGVIAAIIVLAILAIIIALSVPSLRKRFFPSLSRERQEKAELAEQLYVPGR